MFTIDRYDGKGFTSVKTTCEPAMEFLISYALLFGKGLDGPPRSLRLDSGWQILFYGKKRRIQNILDCAIAAWLERDTLAEP